MVTEVAEHSSRFLRHTWGVLHVKHERHSGRASRLLRPVLLAGAATVAWLALSATSASAETGPDLDAAARGLTSGISSLAAPSPHAAKAASPSGSGGDSSGLLSPVTRGVSNSVDRIVASI